MPASHLSPVSTGPHFRAAAGPLRQHRCVRTWAITPRSLNGAQLVSAPGAEAAPTRGVAERDATPALRAGLALASAAVMLASAPSAQARLELPNKEVDDATSPLVQKLLKRSEENRERYQKERLQDYYRRNFKEYFEFEASSAKVARARGLSTESQEAIAKWLQDNK